MHKWIYRAEKPLGHSNYTNLATQICKSNHSSPDFGQNQTKKWPKTPQKVERLDYSFFSPIHPRYLLPFPMHINYAFTSENRPDNFEKIGFNKWKDLGHLPLKCINRQILWDLIKKIASILNLQKLLAILVF